MWATGWPAAALRIPSSSLNIISIITSFMETAGSPERTASSGTRIIFVGDEVFPAIFNIEDRDRIPVRAILHVMDISDVKHPREVAQYEVPEGGSQDRKSTRL